MKRKLVAAATAGSCLLLLSIRLVAGLLTSPPAVRDPDVLAAELAAEPPPAQQVRLAAELVTAPTTTSAAASADRADRERQQAQLAAYESATNPQTRATLIVGLARSKQYEAVPLLLAAMEDEHPVVAGRAIAAIQQLLGVRYPVDQKRLRDPKHRQELAGMAREDWQKLRRYRRFQQAAT
jgi:hypothetical protein